MLEVVRAPPSRKTVLGSQWGGRPSLAQPLQQCLTVLAMTIHIGQRTSVQTVLVVLHCRPRSIHGPSLPFNVQSLEKCLVLSPDGHKVTASGSIDTRSPFPLNVSKIFAFSASMNRSAWVPILAKALHRSKSSVLRLSPCASCGFSQ